MRKSTLLLSFLLIIPALLGTYYIDLNTIWVISSLIPFLALLAVTESTRPAVYGMIEFEISTRFSLKSVEEYIIEDINIFRESHHIYAIC